MLFVIVNVKEMCIELESYKNKFIAWIELRMFLC